ncbi:hypothetical protein EDC56_2354 [Sinobacterium caligoides]|uniref:Uncharacterized protein n=1 Tax=Sinobacterium caligoides TaxID=933926 RepID=A0A3N2DRI0_9GAMM|nr:hypothetical protein [Sinobacterium caligoides]ROS01905.1 hypothetical protein EDC56_2354 [Sinobacterium caligoides]
MSERERGLATVQLEIGSDKLQQLFESGLLCAADVRCLNSASKQQIWRLCLASCASAMGNCPGCDYAEHCAASTVASPVRLVDQGRGLRDAAH